MSLWILSKVPTAIKNRLTKKSARAHSSEKRSLEPQAFLNALMHATQKDLSQVNVWLLVVNKFCKFDYQFEERLKKEIATGSYPDWIQNLRIISLEDTLNETHCYHLDDHLNPRGHEAVANKLAEALRNAN